MRKLLLLLAPVALVACGDDERPVVINTPPAAAPVPNTVVVPTPTTPAPNTVVVPGPTTPGTTVVVPERR